VRGRITILLASLRGFSFDIAAIFSLPLAGRAGVGGLVQAWVITFGHWYYALESPLRSEALYEAIQSPQWRRKFAACE
jgi:hypothetical protein